METFCHTEELLDIDHVLCSPKLGTEGHKKEIQGLIPDPQEFYNVLGDWTHTKQLLQCKPVYEKSDQDLIANIQ